MSFLPRMKACRLSGLDAFFRIVITTADLLPPCTRRKEFFYRRLGRSFPLGDVISLLPYLDEHEAEAHTDCRGALVFLS